MSLKVSLIHDIETVLVTQVIYIRIIRIVTGSDGVEVELLHKPYIRLHLLTGHALSAILAMVMTVHSVKRHRNAVHEELLAAYLNFTETDLCASRLNQRALCIIQRQNERIEIRGLRCPKERVLHLLFKKRIVDIVTLGIFLMVYLCGRNLHVITDLGSRRIIKTTHYIPAPDIRIRIHCNDRTNP